MSDTAAPALNLSVDEVLTTTRSVRKRLDLDRPVPREVLMECLELALQAPTGSNSQGWQWMFVDDPDKKKALADIYRTYATPYLDRPKPEQRAAEVLGIPFDRYSQGGLFPIAYTKGTDFRPARRLPAAQVTHWNSW